MENKNEVLHDEVKAFMNELENPTPAPMFVDDFAPAVDENGNAIPDYKLSTDAIAALAYHAVSMLDSTISPNAWTIWDHLEPHLRLHYTGVVNFYMNSAANPNGHEACQALHDLVIDAKLRDGWRYSETYSEADKTDPTILPYKTLPQHLKARGFLFRCVVVGLVAIWKGH